MKLRELINSILLDKSLDYSEKAKKLGLLVTSKEVRELLPKPEKELPVLKEPLKPKTTDMKVLNLSLHGVYFDAILKGQKPIEFRDYNDYYIKRCTYEENGRRYLVPFDAITFFQGRMRSMTVALKDITCSQSYFMFHLGKILRPPKQA